MNKKEFKVQLTRNKAAVPNHPFKLTTDYIDGTGGHDHTHPRRSEDVTIVHRKSGIYSILARDKFGYFILLRNNTDQDRPYLGQTQEDGRETIDYVSSFFGDRMRLRVETTQPNKKQFLWDTISVAEKVSGLTNFAAITSDIWRLTGNTGSTTYWKCDGTVIHHPANHYGTSYTLRQLQLAIRDFAQWSGTERGYGHYLVLGVNDMSLIYGGMFDICSDWTPPGHDSHRRGTSVDISSSAWRYDGVGLPIDLKTTLARDGFTLLKHLTDIMENQHGTRELEEPIHYKF